MLILSRFSIIPTLSPYATAQAAMNVALPRQQGIEAGLMADISAGLLTHGADRAAWRRTIRRDLLALALALARARDSYGRAWARFMAEYAARETRRPDWAARYWPELATNAEPVPAGVE